MRYVPGTSAGTRYRPSSLVTVSRDTPVSSLTTLTDAPGSAPPVESLTTPEIVLDPVWAITPAGTSIGSSTGSSIVRTATRVVLLSNIPLSLYAGATASRARTQMT